MSLKTKLFCFAVLIPIFVVGYFLSFVSSTFVAAQTQLIYENQLQLLNSVHLLLDKADQQETEKKIKNIFAQEGLNTLIFVDATGLIIYADNPKLIGKPVTESIGDSVLTNVQDQNAVEGSFQSTDSNNKKLLVSFFKFDLSEKRVFMLLTKPKEIATRAASLFIIKSGFSFLALLAFFLVTSQLIYRYFTQSLNQLAEALEGLGDGNWLTPVPAAFGGGEVGTLTNNFTVMRKKLSQHIQDEQRKSHQLATTELSTAIRNVYLPPSVLNLETLRLAAALESASNGGTFWHYCEKISDQKPYLLFLLAEAPPGVALASLSGLCRWALEKNPDEIDPQQNIQSLSTLISSTFGKNVSWNYCLCSINLTSGEMKWAAISHTTPTPLLFNSETAKVQIGSDGQIHLKPGDFIILHSQKTSPVFTIPPEEIVSLTAGDLLNLIKPNVLLSKKKKDNKETSKPATVTATDQSYLVVKWGTP